MAWCARQVVGATDRKDVGAHDRPAELVHGCQSVDQLKLIRQSPRVGPREGNVILDHLQIGYVPGNKSERRVALIQLISPCRDKILKSRVTIAKSWNKRQEERDDFEIFSHLGTNWKFYRAAASPPRRSCQVLRTVFGKSRNLPVATMNARHWNKSAEGWLSRRQANLKSPEEYLQ